MRRFATAILLLGPITIVSLLPLRPLLFAVWPAPVEELVTIDGGWTLTPVIGSQNEPDKNIVRARTRPLSLVELETVDGDRLYGYLIEKGEASKGEAALRIKTGPDRVQVIPSADLVALLYPNDMSLAERFRLALGRIRSRHPLS